MLKNLSPRFIEELGSPNPQPFAILEIEGAGVSDEATTEAHWTANEAESNVDYDSTPPPPDSGNVILAVDTGGSTATSASSGYPTSTISNEWDSGDHDSVNNASDASYLEENSGSSTEDNKFWGALNIAAVISETPDNAYIVNVQVTARCWTDDANNEIRVAFDDGTARWSGDLVLSGGGSFTNYSNSWPTNPITAAVWQKSELAVLGQVAVSAYSFKTSSTIRCSSLYLTVTYYDFETSGYIEVELDLTGANTDNDIIVSIDDVIPTGAGLTHELFYGPAIEMRPTNHYDPISITTNETDAYDGDDTDASSTIPTSSGDAFDIGRDSGNNDQWESELAYVGTVRMFVVAERIAGTGALPLGVIESDSSPVGTLLMDNSGGVVAKQTFVRDVTAFVGDLSDLRLRCFASSTGTVEVKIYDIWIEGYTAPGIAVGDGSRVPTLGYETFKTKSSFTSDGTVTPVLKSISLEVPDRIYRFTSRRGGIFGALPYLIGIPGRSISIDLKDFVTLGSDLKVGLQKDESVIQMLRENYFKNLHASVQIGMYRDDITEADLAYTFQGKVDGYRVGMEEVPISLKDGTKDLSAKWPAGIPIAEPGTHMVDVINTILDDVGIASRYISRGSLDTLKATVGDGSPASFSYVVYRGNSPPVAVGDTIITEPETAKKVVGELVELLGAYMVSQEDGKIYVVEYDSSKASIGDPWTRDDFVEDPVYNPDVENLINDTYVYFDWNGEGTDAKDFSNMEPSPDATSITNWGETNTRVIKSKWLAGSAADGYYGEELAIHIGARETERRKNGQGIFPCKTSLKDFELQTGDMKDIDMSDLIINPDVGAGDVRKFMVVSKDPDWENDTISWSLVEAR